MLKKTLLPLFFFCCPVVMLSQAGNAETILLKRLDSIRNSHSIANHFGALYFSTTEKAIKYFRDKEPSDKSMIERFETRFAGFFFEAADAFQSGDSIPAVWKNYFSDTGYTPIAFKFFGLNAHINGDIWRAMVTEFTLQELKLLKRPYSAFHYALKKQYLEFYKEACRNNTRMKKADLYTFGLSKLYGKMLLKKWRKRQYRLATLFYTSQGQFELLLKKTNRKKEHIDRLIIKHLTPGFVIFADSKQQGTIHD